MTNRGTILLFGPLADPVTAFMATRMMARGIDHILMDWRQYPDEFDIAWTLENAVSRGEIRYGNRVVPLDEVKAVFVRQLELCDLLALIADALPVMFINRLPTHGSNSSKPYQQQIIRRHGFEAPKTLVTNIPEDARRFYDECGGRVICKSVSDQMSVVRRVKPEDLERLDQIRTCPTHFQEYVAGIETRVHTIGNRLFATEIASDAIDYRYAAREGRARGMRGVELPPEIAERCLALANDLGLLLSGIDLRRSPDGRYHCFEVNTMPGFTFFENVTRQRMGDALIDLMSRGSN